MDLIRSIFAQTTQDEANDRLDVVVQQLRDRHPKVADKLVEAEEELLAYATFPTAHWLTIWSTNPLERLNREIKRRIDVVGIFPNRAAVLRLIGALLMEQDDEWLAGRRYISAASMAAVQPTMERVTTTHEMQEVSMTS